ncbi:hypothetical protein ACJX0J_036366, partial [Zea mays]
FSQILHVRAHLKRSSYDVLKKVLNEGGLYIKMHKFLQFRGTNLNSGIDMGRCAIKPFRFVVASISSYHS